MAIVWSGTSFDVFAQYFTASGQALTDAILITDAGFRSDAAALSNGNLVVAYSTFGTGTPRQLRADIVDAAGNTVQTSTFFAHPEHSVSVDYPKLVAQQNGLLAVFSVDDLDGSDRGVFAIKADLQGQPIGAAQQVNQTTIQDQDRGVASDLIDGRIAIAFEGRGIDGSSDGIAVRLFDANGTATSDQTRVNQTGTGLQVSPEITGLSDGGFLVTWTGETNPLGAIDYSVFGRVYAADGTPRTGEFLIPTDTTAEQTANAVAATPDGGFVVLWQQDSTRNNPDGTVEIRFQRFDAEGERVGEEVVLPASGAEFDRAADVFVDENWVMYVSWNGTGDSEFTGATYFTSAVLQSPATQGDDTFAGTDTPDVIFGLGGNDNFLAGAGADFLNGGGGLDVVAFRGASGEYAVSTNGGVDELLTEDQLDGRDGQDHLTGIERLQFADGTLAFDLEANAGQTYRLYQAAFDRDPDAEGLGFWIRNFDAGNVGLVEMSEFFMQSEEFAQRYGNPSTLSDNDFLTLLYANVLDRTPDQAGFDFWSEQQDSGLSRAEILRYFSESVENYQNVAAEISEGIWFL